MKARQYDKRVIIKTVVLVSDGAAGSVPSDQTTNETRWAKVKNVSEARSSQLKEEYGLDQNIQLLRFTFRSFTFNRATSVLEYNGDDYRPLAVQADDQYSVDLTIIATKV